MGQKRSVGVNWVLFLFLTSSLLPMGLPAPVPPPGKKVDLPSVHAGKEPTTLVKRSAEEPSPFSSSGEEAEEQERDPYPMLISKKSATVLNKLVTALRNSIDQNAIKTSDFLREKELIPLRNSANYEMFNLQRRNQKDRKNYLRCYFNAVSCF